METEAKLSIILPVYNGEKYLENTIMSVLSSSYQNLELLLIDDGSKDRSLEICEKFAGMDSRIKVFHKENEGIAATRNFGLDHATGDYIGFCDQDDEISSEMYQKMMGRILRDGSQAAICGCYRKKGNGAKVVFERYTDEIFSKQLIREKLMFPMLFKGFAEYGNKEISIYTAIWKCVISKKLISEGGLRFDGFVNYEDDFVMLLQLFLNATKISTLSNILYYWNTNAESEMHRCTKTFVEDLECRQQSLIDYVKRELEENDVEKEIVNKYIYVQQCRNVLLILDNFAVMKDEKFLHKMRNIRKNPSVIYIQSQKDLVEPEKGFIRNTLIIPLVRRKKISSAYLLNKYINQIRYFVEKHYIFERLERKIKGC